jgi:TonB family protein
VKRLRLTSAALVLLAAALALSPFPRAFAQTGATSSPAQQSLTEPSTALSGEIHADPDVQAAKLIKFVPPNYPRIAKLAQVEGAVVLQVLIAADGSVQDVRILSGPPLLIPSAIYAVMQWRYRPTLLSGEPVTVDSVVSVLFSLAPNANPPASSQPSSPSAEVDKTFLAHHVRAPKVIKMVRPKYPREARKERVEGNVILYLMIATDGTVKDLTFVSGAAILRTAAIDAVSKWRYRPCLVDGKPVEVDSIVTVVFRMK